MLYGDLMALMDTNTINELLAVISGELRCFVPTNVPMGAFLLCCLSLCYEENAIFLVCR